MTSANEERLYSTVKRSATKHSIEFANEPDYGEADGREIADRAWR
jgi:hypothetical protein